MLSTIIININCILSDEDINLGTSSTIPYVEPMLSSLYHNNINTILLSDKTAAQTNSLLMKNLMSKYFDIVISDVESNNICDILEDLDISNDDTLFIDNTPDGVICAYEEGITCIVYSSVFSCDEFYKACLLLESYEDIDYDYLNTQYLRAHRLPVTIECTQRLVIRELTSLDIYSLHSIYSESSITKYIEPMSSDIEIEVLKHNAYIDNVYNFYGYGLWGVFLSDTNTLIGRCGVSNITLDDGNVVQEVGYLIGKDYQRKGYAFEAMVSIIAHAFACLDITDLFAVINEANQPSINLAYKLGFSPIKKITRNGAKCLLFSISRASILNTNL